MAQTPRVVAQACGVHTNLSRYCQAIQLSVHMLRACACARHNRLSATESIQCSARIPSARATTAHVRDVSSLALCGHDVTDTLPVRFAPHRGIDVCHCRTSVAFQAPAPHTNRAPQTNQYIVFCAILFSWRCRTEIHGRATNLAQTLLHALLWVCLRLALVRQLIAVRCGNGNMVLAARFGGYAQ